MPTVRETIPEHLAPQVAAALDWFNAQEMAEFEVTGIVDAGQSLDLSSGATNLRLVLCGGDTCQQQQFRVTRIVDGRSRAFDRANP